MSDGGPKEMGTGLGNVPFSRIYISIGYIDILPSIREYIR